MKYLKAFGIIVGLMFGAGIFALPFAVVRAGMFWGAAHLVIAFLLMVFTLFLYAGITFHIGGKHRFTGYVEKILGKKYKRIAFFIIAVVYYFVLLAYGVLGGVFLSNFFHGQYSTLLSFVFFALGAFLVYLKLQKIAFVNLFLSLPLFVFVIFLLFSSLSFIDLSNFSLGLTNFSFGDISWFLPYGVWIFSLTAFAAIPEAHDVIFPCELKNFKKVIFASLLLATVFYGVFIFNIIGITGSLTTKDSLSGLLGVVGRSTILTGSIIGFLAVFTSFLIMATDLRGIFRFDFGIPRGLAWFFTIAPPVLLFSLGFQNFTRIISLAGSLGMGFTGSFLIFMAWKIRQKSIFKNKRFTVIFEFLALGAILLAVVYEIYSVL